MNLKGFLLHGFSDIRVNAIVRVEGGPWFEGKELEKERGEEKERESRGREEEEEFGSSGGGNGGVD